MDQLYERSKISHLASIDPRAVVDATVTIGHGVRIWQFATIVRQSTLCDDASVSPCAIVDGAWIGKRSIVGPHVLVSPGALVGDDVFIGPNVTFCNDAWPAVSKEGFIADLLRGDYVTINVKDGASIGANSVLLPGITIGKRAMVGAGVAARIDVPDDHLLLDGGVLKPIKPEWRERRMREAR